MLRGQDGLEGAIDTLVVRNERVAYGGLTNIPDDSLTRSTLAKAFRGELVPQSAGDSPASAVLTPLRVGGSDTDRDAAAVPRKRTKAKTVR